MTIVASLKSVYFTHRHSLLWAQRQWRIEVEDQIEDLEEVTAEAQAEDEVAVEVEGEPALHTMALDSRRRE